MDVVLASTMQVRPGQGRSGGLVDLLIVVAVLGLIAISLFFLFRRGSIADRARRQELESDATEGPTDAP